MHYLDNTSFVVSPDVTVVFPGGNTDPPKDHPPCGWTNELCPSNTGKSCPLITHQPSWLQEMSSWARDSVEEMEGTLLVAWKCPLPLQRPSSLEQRCLLWCCWLLLGQQLPSSTGDLINLLSASVASYLSSELVHFRRLKFENELNEEKLWRIHHSELNFLASVGWWLLLLVDAMLMMTMIAMMMMMMISLSRRVSVAACGPHSRPLPVLASNQGMTAAVWLHAKSTSPMPCIGWAVCLMSWVACLCKH